MTKPNRTASKSEKKNSGRPSIYSNDLADLICERLACGESLRSICEDTNLPDRITVIRWLSKGGDFATKYARAREVQSHVWVDDMFELARSAPERNPVTGAIDSASVSHIRNQVATMQWLAQKLNPKRYGDKLDMNHGVQQEDPLATLIKRISGTGLPIVKDVPCDDD